jgi:hypothetical protein
MDYRGFSSLLNISLIKKIHCELVDWKKMALVNKIGICVVKVVNCHIDGSIVCLGIRYSGG